MRSWLLIEVTGPWGRDAITQSELGPYAPRVWRDAMRLRGIRLIAIRRDLTTSTRHGHHEVRLVHVEAPALERGAGVAHRRVIADLHEVVPATESLAVAGAVGDRWTVDTDRYVLVCTNGRHDSCCATFGRPLVRALRRSQWADEVWECSHVGGDRFAANIVLLPDSLYFGNVDEASAQRLLEAHADGRLDLTCFRGRSTLRLPAQAAEHEVRTRLGLDRLDAVRGIATVDGVLEVALADGRTVQVGVERIDHPSPTRLTCKGNDGLAYPEWRVTTFNPSEG